MPPSQLAGPFEQKKQQILDFVNEARQKEFHAALEAIFRTSEGRLIFGEIFKEFHLYNTPHESHGAMTSFNCGEQNVCFRIRDWLRGAGIYMDYWHLIEKDAMERNEKWENLAAQQIEDLTATPKK